jgi:hypothetical protein
MEGSSISKIQCSFEIEPNKQVVMLYDRSHGQTTQVFGDNATPFEHGRLRKVAVNVGLNTRIGMGGEARDLVLFDLEWSVDVIKKDAARIRQRETVEYKENPRLARTIDEADTALPTRRQTRVHTARQLKLRYETLDLLGTGKFGTVHKVLDVDAGRFLAVKSIEVPVGALANTKQLDDLKREVEILAGISHVGTSILTFSCMLGSVRADEAPATHRRIRCFPRLGWADGGNIHGPQAEDARIACGRRSRARRRSRGSRLEANAPSP